jgi:hypothetical protein
MSVTWTGLNGMAYFQFPNRGTIYEVPIEVAKDSRFYVRLGPPQDDPNNEGEFLQLRPHGKNYGPVHTYMLSEEAITRSQERKIVTASRVFDPHGDETPIFKNNWVELIWQINASAATNNLFHIILTNAEYKRLEKGRWDKILQLLSPRAQSMIQLHKNFYMDEEERPAVELVRTGCCP